MELQPSGPERRLAHLEAQIDRLNLALQQWRETQDHLQPMERRLAQLTEQCADILKQWSVTGERHAQAVGELEVRLTGWNDVETRLQRDATRRFQALEQIIENEWASLRNLHEEPARQLRAHAESLAEISVAAAGSAQTGLERAEARLATLERDLHRRMDDLSRELHTALADLQRRGGSAPRSDAAPWSFDEVTRLHHDLRESDTARTPLGTGASSDEPADAMMKMAPPRSRSLLGSTNDSEAGETAIETAASSSAANNAITRPRSESSHWKWASTLAVLALGLGIAATLAVSFYRQAGAAAVSADEAKKYAEEIAAAADRRIESAQQDAAERIRQASEAASKAQVTGDVLAAPDLIRFNLSGGDTSWRSTGQLLWSRSRGMVFSASRLPALSTGTTYQVWLLTTEQPVSAGTFIPDAAGRVTAAMEVVPNVPRPVTGALVTLEPEPGRPSPSGTIVLARAQ